MGRMAMALDPQGHFFGLWQSDDTTGITVYNEPGALTWNDAAVQDVASPQRFYGESGKMPSRAGSARLRNRRAAAETSSTTAVIVMSRCQLGSIRRPGKPLHAKLRRMTDAAVALNQDGTVMVLPKHALSSLPDRTVCGKAGAGLIGMRWEKLPAVDQCSECTLFLSAEN